MSKETKKRIQSTKIGERTMIGAAFYQILANPAYANEFQYIPAMTPDRASLIEDDDACGDNDVE